MRRRRAFFLLPGVALFTLLLRQLGLGHLLRQLAGQGPRFLFVLVPMGIAYLLFALAWWLALAPADRRRIGFGRLLLIQLAGFSINGLTPVVPLGGEPLKMGLLSRRLDRVRAVGSVLAYDALHVLSHLVTFLVAGVAGLWLLRGSPLRLGAVAALTLLVGIVVAGILACLRRGLVRPLFGFLGRRRRLQDRRERLDELEGRLGRYEETVTGLYRARRGTFWASLGLDFAGRAVWAMEVLVMLRGVGTMIDPLRAYFVHAVTTLLSSLAFFVPYQLGSREAAYYLALSWLGLDPEAGVYLGVASRLREAAWAGVGLAIALVLGAGILHLRRRGRRREAAVRRLARPAEAAAADPTPSAPLLASPAAPARPGGR